MAHHKRRRPKHQRAGCLYCKPHKDERAARELTAQELRHPSELADYDLAMVDDLPEDCGDPECPICEPRSAPLFIRAPYQGSRKVRGCRGGREHEPVVAPYQQAKRWRVSMTNVGTWLLRYCKRCGKELGSYHSWPFRRFGPSPPLPAWAQAYLDAQRSPN